MKKRIKQLHSCYADDCGGVNDGIIGLQIKEDDRIKGLQR